MSARSAAEAQTVTVSLSANVIPSALQSTTAPLSVHRKLTVSPLITITMVAVSTPAGESMNSILNEGEGVVITVLSGGKARA